MAKDKYAGTKGLKAPQALRWLEERFRQYDLNDSQTKQAEEAFSIVNEYIKNNEKDVFAFQVLEEANKITNAQYKFIRQKEKEQ